MIRVLVIAQSAEARDELERALQGEREFVVLAGSAGAGSTRLVRAADSGADVLVVDLPEADIEDALTRVATPDELPAIVAVLDISSRADLMRAWENGVRAVVHRHASVEEIREAVRAAHAGLAVFSAADLHLWTRARSDHADEPVLRESLTAREIEVLGMLAAGLGNKAIAARLGISDHTVKFHVSSILAKLGAESRTEAVTRAVREGLLTI